MTVREMINALEAVVEDYGEEYEDTEVVIAEYQTYGSDFAYNVSDIDAGIYNDWDEMIPNNNDDDSDNDEPNCIKIILGRQIGTMQDDY